MTEPCEYRERDRRGVDWTCTLPGGHEPQAHDCVMDLGWWSISGNDLLAALRRCAGGEDPDLVYAEFYANATVKAPDDRSGSSS